MTQQSAIRLGTCRHMLTWVMTVAALALPRAAPVTAADISAHTPWDITLDEAIVMGMEHGRIWREPDRCFDCPDEDLEIALVGPVCLQQDSINARVHVINCAKNAGSGAASPATRFVIAPRDLDMSQAEFARSVSEQIANVETAYWNLYGSYGNLYSCESALRMAQRCCKISKAKHEAGTMPVTEYAQTLEQHEQFRGDRIVALGTVIENERILRALLGLRMEDGKRLVPVDTPTVVQYRPNWETAYKQCMSRRPDLVVQRNDLKQKQLELVRANNQDGDVNIPSMPIESGAEKAAVQATEFRMDVSTRFPSGDVIYPSPLVEFGFRRQNPAVRAAKLRLSQSYLQLRDQECRAERYLRAQYDTVIQKYHEIKARQHQREAALEQREARAKEFAAGKTTADFLFQTQLDWVAACNSECQAVVDYNNALVRFEFAKGTLLQHQGIAITEGLLP